MQGQLTEDERAEYDKLLDYMDDCDHPWKVPDPIKDARFRALRDKMKNA